MSLFIIAAGLGGFLLVLGTLIFLVDAFHVHWGWGVSALLVTFMEVACLVVAFQVRWDWAFGALLIPFLLLAFLFKHWDRVQKGFLLRVLAYGILVGAYFLQPKPVAGEEAHPHIKDPFAAAMSRARSAVAHVQESRSEVPELSPVPSPANGSPPTPVGAVPSATTSRTPVLTAEQRMIANRQRFRDLEKVFADLQIKRKNLPKGDLEAMRIFNAEAAAYSRALEETRAEQDVLTRLQNQAH